MPHPTRVDAYDFDLPRQLIATRPAEPREAARLLHVRGGPFPPLDVADLRVADLPDLLRPGDLLVFNDTRVIPARLTGTRGAARIEVTLHRRLDDAHWRVFAKGAKKLKAGDTIVFAPDFAAAVVEKHPEGDVTLRFDPAGPDLRAALERHGTMPLPPYIAREGGADARDSADYQTMFARQEGAVAAPTAGLHFTPGLLAACTARGARFETVTLHVGAGTFQPVKVEDTREHRMHAETGTVTSEAAARINAARAAGGRIVAVGTTSLRLLESAADADGTLRAFEGETALFITPDYRFKAIQRLMTNFHLPRSTLFMLVSAFAGLDRMKAAYAHAVAGEYRFFSYGDATFLEPQPEALIR